MELFKRIPASGSPLTPIQIVAELDKFIVGQEEAKKSVAIALRNRWRRQQIPEHLRDKISSWICRDRISFAAAFLANTNREIVIEEL